MQWSHEIRTQAQARRQTTQCGAAMHRCVHLEVHLGSCFGLLHMEARSLLHVFGFLLGNHVLPRVLHSDGEDINCAIANST